jgi:hypothetical protein
MGAFGSQTGTGIQAYDTSDNSANNFMINPFGGNIGINETNPQYRLHMDRSDGSDNVLAIQNSSTARLSELALLDESGNKQVRLLYDNGSNIGQLIVDELVLSGNQYKVKGTKQSSPSYSADDWINLAEITYGEVLGIVGIEWNTLAAPSTAHHGYARLKVGSYYSSYFYGWETTLELLDSSQHNSFYFKEFRIVRPDGYTNGAPILLQGKVSHAVSGGSLQVWVEKQLGNNSGPITPLQPVTDNTPTGNTVQASIVLTNRAKKGSYGNQSINGDLYVNGLGIGTTTPSHMVNLVSTGAAGIHIQADSDNVDESHTAYLSMSQDGGTSQMLKLGIEGSAGSEFTNSIGNAVFLHANNAASQPLQFAHDGSAIMTLQSGKVGIGTNAPGNLLSLNGADQGITLNTTNDGGITYLLFNEAGANAARFSVSGQHTSSVIELENYSGSWSDTGLKIKGNQLGIGIEPSAKLHVYDGNNIAKLGDLYGTSTMALEMYDNAANPVAIEAYSDKMAWRMTGAHRMWLDQGGNLYPASPNVSDLGTSGTWWDQSYIRTINYNSEWYNYASGNIPSDSNWYQIFTALNGHHVFDIRVQMSDSGVHTSGVIRVCVTFASGAIHAETSGTGYSSNIEARITGSTYSYNIELRHTTTAGTQPIYWRAKRINS